MPNYKPGTKASRWDVPIRANRCESCGHAIPVWTPTEMIKAARAWTLRHGRPPYSTDWREAGHDHPTWSVVRGFFVTWENFMKAAGLPARPKGWAREECERALLVWVYKHGRVPRRCDWLRIDPAHERPTSSTIRNLYGTWNAFLEAAGYPVNKAWTPREQRLPLVAVA